MTDIGCPQAGTSGAPGPGITRSVMGHLHASFRIADTDQTAGHVVWDLPGDEELAFNVVVVSVVRPADKRPADEA